MPNFVYRAMEDDGKRIYGREGAAVADELKARLAGQGLAGCDVFETKTNIKAGHYQNCPPRELSIFCRQMSVMFFSYVTLMEGVKLLHGQTECKQLKLALDEIYTLMDQGYTLAESMNMYHHIFGGYLLGMVVIGESSGSLDSIFSRMSDFFDKESKLRKKLRSAITYPAVLGLLMAAIIVLLIVEILPMFGSILNDMGQDMNAITAGILAAGTFLSTYGLIIIAVIAALVVVLLLYKRTERGAVWYDKMKLRMPVVRYITARTITARFAASLSILVKSGIQLVNALEETKSVINNRYLAPKMDKLIEDVKGGKELSEALEELGVFPPLFLKMVLVGQSTGRLDDMLDKSSAIFDEDVDDAIEKVTAMIEPALIIILSVVVGFILVSVMLPMIDVMNNIG